MLASDEIVNALKGEDGEENQLHFLGVDTANLDEYGGEDTHHGSQAASAFSESAFALFVNQDAHVSTHQAFENARHQHTTAKDSINQG